MPKEMEFFPPPKKSPETKPEGKVSNEEGIKIWRADEAKFAAGPASSESGKAREFIVPKKEKSEDKIIKKADVPISVISEKQKSDNVIKMGDAQGPRAQRYYRSRQEAIEKQKRVTRRAKTDLISGEAEKYEALFNQ